MSAVAARVAARYLEAEFVVEAMSNVPSADSGVEGVVIWVSPGTGAGGARLPHGPRIKVVSGARRTTEGVREGVIVTVSANPRIVHGALSGDTQQRVFEFVKLNEKVLKDHWDGVLSSKETLNALKPVPSRLPRPSKPKPARPAKPSKRKPKPRKRD